MAEQILPSSRTSTSSTSSQIQNEETIAYYDRENVDGNTYTITTESAVFTPTHKSRLNSAGSDGFLKIGPRESTQRPAAIVKKARRRLSGQADQISSEMRPVLHLIDVFSRKTYIEGYLCKQDQSWRDGRKPTTEDWGEFYAEICGSSLCLWRVSDDIESAEITSPNPTTINIANSSVEIVGKVSDSILSRDYVFSLDGGEGDLYYLQTSSWLLLNRWVLAIRLSCFEGSRLHEVFTATLFRRSGFKELLSGTPLIKGKVEGYLQVRFAGTKEWQKCWVVVSDHRVEEKKKKDLAFDRGQATFYKTKKSKKPFMTMANVLQAYAIYQETASTIEKTTLFRVEGNIFATKASTADSKPSDFVLLTAENSSEMAKWLIAFCDSFKLYGRPKEYLYDFKDPDSPLFAVPIVKSTTKLFLDVSEVEHVDMQQSLADLKAEFAEILRKLYLEHPQEVNAENEFDHASHQPTARSSRKSSGSIPPQIVTNGLSDSSSRQKAFFNESGSSIPSPGSSSSTRSGQQSSSRSSVHSQGKGLGSTNSPISSKFNLFRDIPSSPSTSSLSSERRVPERPVVSSSRLFATAQKSGKEKKSETDSEVDDPTLLKNTQANAKTSISDDIKLDSLEEENNETPLVDEPLQLDDTSIENSGGDLMSEILTAIDEHKEEKPAQSSSKKPKPKRTVSFKNPPPKPKHKSKIRVSPLPSDSEEEEDDDDVDENITNSEESQDEQKEEQEEIFDVAKSSKINKIKSSTLYSTSSNSGSNLPTSTKNVGKGKKKKKFKVAPKPSDSEDDEETTLKIVQPQLSSSRPRPRELNPRQDYEEVRPYSGDYRQNSSYGYMSPKAPYADRSPQYSPKSPSYPYSPDRNYHHPPSPSFQPVARGRSKDEYSVPNVRDDHVPLGRASVRSHQQVAPAYKPPQETTSRSKGKKPVKKVSEIVDSLEESSETEEFNQESEIEESDDNESNKDFDSVSSVAKGKTKATHKVEQNAPGDDSFGLPSVALNIDFGALTLDSVSGTSFNDKDNIKEKSKEKQISIESNESSNEESSNESSNSENEDDDMDLMNKPRRIFKPTKRSDKKKSVGKPKTRPRNSSEGSNSSSISLTSSHEPLVMLVTDSSEGAIPPFTRGYANTPPRSVSPNNKQYWENEYGDPRGVGVGYAPAFGENRRSSLMPPREFYEDDRANGIGGRPRSIVNPSTGRRRTSGGQAEHMREQRDSYFEEEYYDERDFQPRPTSLLGALSQQLSARDQQYLARETGAPLIQLEERQKDPQFGLVGAITARERQRKVGRQIEHDRELALEKERERRLMEQRQQLLAGEREYAYARQYGPPSPIGGDPRSSTRFYGNQQYLDTGSGPNSRRGSYYESYGSGSHEEDEDDDVPLGVAPPSPVPRQMRGARVGGGSRRRDTE
ncbi:4551_t:CDS:2 [Ambispora gerdemannii]|uniref:4551_t:CDS:1 n=1 Tax=Ambispora gerdemannii TaxID=144530 RepID=A0A9N9AKH7_9GLOM|nr:4551_t:CDS:2 [Ambispora gerdemannii]